MTIPVGGIPILGTFYPAGALPIVDAQGTQIANVLDPTHAQDAATKTYIDGLVAFLPGFINLILGDGVLGNVTISGVHTLTSDEYYNNLTVNGAAVITFNGWQIYCSGTLDISAAPTGAFVAGGAGNGGNASGATSGTSGVGISPNTNAGSSSSNASANATTGAGTAGIIGAVGNQGGNAGASGAGGAGTNAGGAGAALTANNGVVFRQWRQYYTIRAGGSYNPIGAAGAAGASGGTGGGSGALAGGGAGAGGAAGGGIRITCKTLVTGTNTNTAIFQAKGGNGGNGAAGAGAAAGGGGGGSAGGGGWVIITFFTRTGSPVANAIDVSGGKGGDGGDGGTGAAGGDGGGNGASGRASVYDMLTPAIVDTYAGTVPTAGGAHSGATHGTGAAAISVQIAL